MQPLDRRTRASTARWIATLALALIAALAARFHAPQGGYWGGGGSLPERVSGAARAIDGDSLFVGRDEVRLQGIDAPEGRQTCRRDNLDWACGDASRDQLRALIGKDVIACRVTKRDQHGRLLAYCSAGGRDINAGMVASGMAVAYGGYLREEGEAKARKKGLWSSEFKRPRA